LSTDRGSVIRSRVKVDTTDNQPIAKVPFPARVSVNKSVAAMPMIPSTDSNSRVHIGSQEQFPARFSVNKSVPAMPMIPSTDSNSRVHIGSQEPAKHDNISDAYYSLQKISTKKVYPEHEEEQFKQALNVRQGGIRKSKAESKAKAKHNQLPGKSQKSEAVTTLLSDMHIAGQKVEEVPRKSDFPEPENEQGLVGSPVHGALKVKKLQQNFPRISQNLEPRYDEDLLSSGN
jgi:kinesin family protein C2/C3